MIVKSPVRELALPATTTLQEVMEVLERTARGVVLVIDDDFRLLSTITDGDLRRGLLAGLTLQSPLSEILQRKVTSEYPVPLTVRPATPPDEMLKLMEEHSIRHVPVVDEEGHVVDLVTLDQLAPHQGIRQAVIMAGGLGKRLHPLTENVPKPMLPLGDRPLLEHTIEQLRNAGIHQLNLTTHYLPEKITDHFGDGSNFGVDLNYISEDTPLGTAGALALMEVPKETILVINGDVVTQVDFQTILNFHREQGAVFTVGVRQYDLQVPYGVIESDGVVVTGLREKPVVNCLVNAGIYLLEPSVLQFIPNGERFDMTDLIKILLEKGLPVASFLIVEYWLDIGRPEDYVKAQEDAKSREAAL